MHIHWRLKGNCMSIFWFIILMWVLHPTCVCLHMFVIVLNIEICNLATRGKRREQTCKLQSLPPMLTVEIRYLPTHPMKSQTLIYMSLPTTYVVKFWLAFAFSSLWYIIFFFSYSYYVWESNVLMCQSHSVLYTHPPFFLFIGK